MNAPRIVPAILLDLQHNEQPARLMFEGLVQHYCECMAAGRLEDWRRAGHAIVDFLGSQPPDAPFAKRETLGDRTWSPQ